MQLSHYCNAYFNSFKIKKTIIFVPKLDQNHYIAHNSAKSLLETPKISEFFLKNLNLPIFSAPSAPEIWSFMSKKSWIIWSVAPQGRGSSSKLYSYIYVKPSKYFLFLKLMIWMDVNTPIHATGLVEFWLATRKGCINLLRYKD